ncbi:MAG: tRNA glutamyl-Q(34) synthetase GluQRS [Gammaproteobacteria bacterium]|jgi:glutamyl-Q tRNA(Asp) synthetase
MIYRGRFAPSPTGSLHFGSLVSAVASYLDARRHDGAWYLRIEDVDKPREKPGSAASILSTLENFGMQWDGDVLYQSQRHDAYAGAIRRLLEERKAFHCSCSRKRLAESSRPGEQGLIYPGTCRDGHDRGAPQLSVRLLTDNEPVQFEDRILGRQTQQVAREVGDFIIRRADGFYAYQLAVVVDDAFQQITHIVRGEDLLFSTARQIRLQHALGYATPSYAHHPLVRDGSGHKLGKSTSAWPVDSAQPLATLGRVLEFLHQQPVEADTIDSFWKQAIAGWNIEAMQHA